MATHHVDPPPRFCANPERRLTPSPGECDLKKTTRLVAERTHPRDAAAFTRGGDFPPTPQTLLGLVRPKTPTSLFSRTGEKPAREDGALVPRFKEGRTGPFIVRRASRGFTP